MTWQPPTLSSVHRGVDARASMATCCTSSATQRPVDRQPVPLPDRRLPVRTDRAIRDGRRALTTELASAGGDRRTSAWISTAVDARPSGNVE